MKPFDSFLADELEAYIHYRNILGFKTTSLRFHLRYLDRYIYQYSLDIDSINPQSMIEYKKWLTRNLHDINNVISSTRVFFEFLIRQDIISENPLKNIPADKKNAFIPFIFSQKQVNELLVSIAKRIRKDKSNRFFNDLTIYMVISLLARCGMRISEPLNLKMEHYSKHENTLYIENTKFSKDRLIPIPMIQAYELNNYLSVRKHFVKKQSPYLLPGINGNKFPKPYIYASFHQTLKDIGIHQSRQIIENTTFGPPTPHSLRHSFACNTMKRIRESGKSPQQALPVLAAYMGHKKYKYTAVYLKVLNAEQRQTLVNFNVRNQKDI